MGPGIFFAVALAAIIIHQGSRTTVRRLRHLDYAVGGTLAALAIILGIIHS